MTVELAQAFGASRIDRILAFMWSESAVREATFPERVDERAIALPACAAAIRPGIFFWQDQIAEGIGLAVMLESVEQRQKIGVARGDAGLVDAAIAASARCFRGARQSEQAEEAVLR